MATLAPVQPDTTHQTPWSTRSAPTTRPKTQKPLSGHLKRITKPKDAGCQAAEYVGIGVKPGTGGGDCPWPKFCTPIVETGPTSRARSRGSVTWFDQVVLVVLPRFEACSRPPALGSGSGSAHCDDRKGHTVVRQHVDPLTFGLVFFGGERAVLRAQAPIVSRSGALDFGWAPQASTIFQYESLHVTWPSWNV